VRQLAKSTQRSLSRDSDHAMLLNRTCSPGEEVMVRKLFCSVAILIEIVAISLRTTFISACRDQPHKAPNEPRVCT